MDFCFLNKSEKDHYLPQLFDLLYENMKVIAPSGLSYEQEKTEWLENVSPALEKAPRQIVLCFVAGELAGYMQYYIRDTLLMVEEIQLKKKYPEIILKTIPPFPVSNRLAAEESARIGAAMVHAHVELPEDESFSIKQGSPIPVEEYQGNPVLLATRASVKAKGTLKTAQGMRFRIEKRGEFTCILEDI